MQTRPFFGVGTVLDIYPATLPVKESRENNGATCKGDVYFGPPPQALPVWTPAGDYDNFQTSGFQHYTQDVDYVDSFIFAAGLYTFPYKFSSFSGDFSLGYSNAVSGYVFLRMQCNGVTVYTSGNLYGVGNLDIDMSNISIPVSSTNITITVQHSFGFMDQATASVQLSNFELHYTK